MKLDMKDQLILVIYKEYNQDIPDIQHKIRPELLDIEPEVFFNTIDKLQNELLISEAIIKRAYKSHQPVGVLLNHMVITPRGIEYVEKMLEIEKNLSKAEKLKRIGKKVGEWTLEQGKDITAKTLAYLLENMMTQGNS